MKDKFLLISNIIAKYSFAIFIVLFSISNIFFSVRQMNALTDDANYLFIDFIDIVFILLLCILFVFIYKKNFFNISSEKMMFSFLLSGLIIGLYWIFTNPQELKELDDAYNCYTTAYNMSNGDYSWLGFKSYINVYPHNLGLVTYFFIICKIFGGLSLYVIRIINLLFSLAGYFYLYKITVLLFKDERINKIEILLMYLSMQLIFISFFVYGNSISYSLAIISVFYLLKYFEDRKCKYLIISGITVVIAIAIKNNSLIILVAELIYIFLDFIKRINYKYIIYVIVLALTIFVSTAGVIKYYEKAVGVTYDNKLPTICWLAYGVNYEPKHPGRYFNFLEQYHYANNFDAQYTEIEARDYIDRVFDSWKEHPEYAINFYFQKFLTSFANPEYETFAQYRKSELNVINNSIMGGKINDFIYRTWDATSTLISVGLLVYLFKHKQDRIYELMPAVIVFGGFLFHIFWETKAIYLYQYFMYLLPYAAVGISIILGKVKKCNI